MSFSSLANVLLKSFPILLQGNKQKCSLHCHAHTKRCTLTCCWRDLFTLLQGIQCYQCNLCAVCLPVYSLCANPPNKPWTSFSTKNVFQCSQSLPPWGGENVQTQILQHPNPSQKNWYIQQICISWWKTQEDLLGHNCEVAALPESAESWFTGLDSILPGERMKYN